MRILLVKTSSLGDVIHNLPAVSDIRSNLPDARIDWAVEEVFAEIPLLHPAVAEVVRVAPRRWRRGIASRSTYTEIHAVRRRFAERAYDFVIDTQGSLKSALVARLAPGTRVGLDWSSAREPLGWLYDRACHIPWNRHAVERNRALVSQALGFALDARVDYGVKPPQSLPIAIPWSPAQGGGAYAVLLHATSAARKLWPEPCWIALGRDIERWGLTCVLPWGTAVESARSERLARALPRAWVPPRLNLAQVASLLGHARIVFGVDTGLAHLAAALGVPTVGIYCATDPASTGLYGVPRIANVGGAAGPPPPAAVADAGRAFLSEVREAVW